jgi:hypothetical protein
MTSLQNYAGNRQKSSKNMVMKMFATLDKGKPNTANINGLNLAAVKLTIAQVSKLPQHKVGMICCTKSGLTKV